MSDLSSPDFPSGETMTDDIGCVDPSGAVEADRLARLRDLGILDSAQEPEFDRVTRMAAAIFDVPISLISFVDRDRQWFKARHGLDVTQTSRADSFCARAIWRDGIMVIEDAASDPSFKDNPLVVGPPHIRFYAGAPLSLDGRLNLGTLCIIDREPRQLTAREAAILKDLAATVVDSLRNRFVANRAVTSEHRLHDAIESLSDGFVMFDADDRLVLCNQRYRELYAESAADIAVGKTFEEIIRAGIANGQYPDAIGREEAFVQERLARHRNPAGPIEQHLPGDRWIRVDERPTRSGGMVGFRVDITAIKRQERALTQLAHNLEVQLARAEEAEDAKVRFLASVSHELRTPLNAIIGFSQVMQQEMFGPLGLPKYVEYADDIQQSAAHLLSLVDDILDMAKLSSGNVDLACNRVDLSQILTGAVRVIQPIVATKSLTLEIVDDAPDIAIRGDARALRQVLFNLLSNAVKFTPLGGAVSVRIGKADGTVSVAIGDTGPGIPQDVLPKLGQPFQRVGNVMTSSDSGSGLGLAISKALVEKMGGTLAIESQLGEGTTVRVTLVEAS